MPPRHDATSVRHVALTLLAAAAMLLPALAQGDHVYSHRFVFEGRLVGADGYPLPGREVTFFSEGDEFLTPCADTPHQRVTDEWGDFMFCFHKHDLDASTVVGVSVGNVTKSKLMDTAYRRSVVTLRDYEQDGIAPPEWNTTWRIAGRVWSAGDTTLEGVAVYGVAVAHAPVNLSVTTPSGASNYTLTTNAFGDFDATIQLLPDVNASDVMVRAESMGVVTGGPLSALYHRNTFGITIPAPPTDGAPRGGIVQTDFPAAATAQDRPGSDAPAFSGIALLAFVALASLAVYGRWRQQRER